MKEHNGNPSLVKPDPVNLYLIGGFVLKCLWMLHENKMQGWSTIPILDIFLAVWTEHSITDSKCISLWFIGSSDSEICPECLVRGIHIVFSPLQDMEFLGDQYSSIQYVIFISRISFCLADNCTTESSSCLYSEMPLDEYTYPKIDRTYLSQFFSWHSWCNCTPLCSTKIPLVTWNVWSFAFRFLYASSDLSCYCLNRSMKSKLVAIYPDAFPDDSKGELVDCRPNLELLQWSCKGPLPELDCCHSGISSKETNLFRLWIKFHFAWKSQVSLFTSLHIGTRGAVIASCGSINKFIDDCHFLINRFSLFLSLCVW